MTIGGDSAGKSLAAGARGRKQRQASQKGPQVSFFESNGSFIPSKNKSGTNPPPRADNDKQQPQPPRRSFLI